MKSSTIIFLRVFLNLIFLHGCFGQSININDTNLSESDNLNSSKNYSAQHRQKPEIDCSESYSPECIHTSLTEVLERIGRDSSVQLTPGVQLIWNPRSTTESYFTGENSNHQTSSLGKITEYFKSLSLRIQLFHPRTLSFLNSLQSKLFSSLQVSEARKKMKDGGGLIGMGMLMGGSMIMVTLTALGVLAGKAVMTGVLAFLFAALAGLAALKSDDKHLSYEVISRPVVTHGHTHSSEWLTDENCFDPLECDDVFPDLEGYNTLDYKNEYNLGKYDNNGYDSPQYNNEGYNYPVNNET